MDTIRAQPINEEKMLALVWKHFREWSNDSLLLYPIVFMLASFLLVFITRYVDIYLITHADLSDWWNAQPETGIPITSQVSSSALSFLAIVFSISLVALQLANQQYSPRVMSIFERSKTTKITLSLFIATFVYSFSVMIEYLRTSREEITIVSLLTTFVLLIACLIAFIVYMKSVMFMIRVTHIITIIASNTQEAIGDNLLPEGDYVDCQAVSIKNPRQVICYSSPPNTLFVKNYNHGVLRSLELGSLTEIATKHNCVFRILPRFGHYVNEGDPIVEVYGDHELEPDPVVKAFYVEPERGIYQDPAYGFRMLVDMALQALSPAVNAPTTAHQVILRLTHLLARIAQRPEHTGIFADEDNHVRLLHPQTTWEEYVALAFTEIIDYGKSDRQTRLSLETAFEYLLDMVPEAHKSAVNEIKLSL
jgi:uncharacterized membrane protein